MRELSQIDARTEAPARCQLASAVQTAASVLQSRYPDYRVELRVHGSAAVQVGLSAGRIGQILENAVANAQSFAPRGSRIAIELTRDKEPANARIAVTDEGPGFEEPERVFDRFYSSRADRNGHLGLGLSIVRSIAESAGGTVAALNRRDVDSGALLEITLPVVS